MHITGMQILVCFVVCEMEQETFIQRDKMIQKELANYFGIVVEKIIPVRNYNHEW